MAFTSPVKYPTPDRSFLATTYTLLRATLLLVLLFKATTAALFFATFQEASYDIGSFQ